MSEKAFRLICENNFSFKLIAPMAMKIATNTSARTAKSKGTRDIEFVDDRVEVVIEQVFPRCRNLSSPGI